MYSTGSYLPIMLYHAFYGIYIRTQPQKQKTKYKFSMRAVKVNANSKKHLNHILNIFKTFEKCKVRWQEKSY